MTQVSRTSLCVARRSGTRLFLAGGVRSHPAFEGPSERTIFFKPETAEKELRAMHIPMEGIQLIPAKLELAIG